MMKAKDTNNNAFSLVTYLFLLQILINSNKAKASGSWLSKSLPDSDKDEQRCGFESCYEKCPPGSCCSWLGYCGTTIKHCGRQYCQSQCPSPPPPLYARRRRCGMQAEGRKCPTGLCCSSPGWCGTTQYYCDPQYCQSQCRLPSQAPPPPPYTEQCGKGGGGKKCPTGMCCSIWGSCGTTKHHCSKHWCQSQCSSLPPPPPAPGRCGNQAEGRKCPTGLCCSSSGWCGTTQYYCAKQWCQSQCNTMISSTKNSMRGTETFLLDAVV